MQVGNGIEICHHQNIYRLGGMPPSRQHRVIRLKQQCQLFYEKKTNSLTFAHPMAHSPTTTELCDLNERGGRQSLGRLHSPQHQISRQPMNAITNAMLADLIGL